MTSTQMPAGIAMPCPFATPFLSGETASVVDVSTVSVPSESVVSFKKGFGTGYAAPSSEGGKYVMRGEMNGFGKALGVDTFRYKSGMVNTFDASFAAAIGGYPKGSVLDLLLGNQLFSVVSMIDNNTVNFLTAGVDGANWKYCNKDYGTAGDILACSIGFNSSNTNILRGVQLGTFLASTSGFLCAKNVSGSVAPVEATVDPVYSIAIAGCSIICKEIGTTLVAVDPPSYSTSNGWVSIPGITQMDDVGLLGGITLAIPQTTGGYQESAVYGFSQINMPIEAGKYYAVGIVCGLKKEYKNATGTALTAFMASNFSCDLVIRQ